MREFEIGDEAWIALSSPRKRIVPCPVCFGKRQIVVILGDDSRVEVACGYCRPMPSLDEGGTDVEYDHSPAAEKVKITGKSVEDGIGGRRVEYRYGLDGHFAHADEVFETEADALAAAAVKVAALDAHDRDCRQHRKKEAMRKAGWSVGYHRREAKRMREEADRHERWAIEIKAAARGEDPRHG